MYFKYLILGILLLGQSWLTAQEKMNLSAFYAKIKNDNPQLKIAEIQHHLGKIQQLKSKGFLDPKITTDLNEKNFNDKRYYRLFDAKLKVPTAYGIDFIGGYQNTLGEYLNPENKTPDNGLFYLGIEANLWQGLWINNTRMNRNEAQNTAEMYRQISQQTKNVFYYSAGKSYLEWEENQALIYLYKKVVDLSKNYLNQTKETYFLGEKTAIDTLESHLAWQDWKAQLEGVAIKENQLAQKLKYYLFDNDEIALFQYDDELSKVAFNLKNIDVSALPEIREKEEKLNAYQWQERLKREKLKPKLKVKYSPLISDKPTGDYDLDFKNYKWGFGFSYHLFNRQAKADLQENRAKQALLKWETDLKKKSIETKLEASEKNIELLENQYLHWLNIAQGNKQILEGEQTKFTYGESSVFLITKRQEKWIKTQQKTLALYYKWQKEKLYYLFLSNQILDEFGLD